MIIIKRYSNRKLYDTSTRQYVSLEDIGSMIRAGQDLQVLDHRTGNELTSLILLQVLFAEEKKIGGHLPQVVVKRLIRSGSRSLDSLRRGLFAFLSPMEMIDREIKTRIEQLIKEDKVSKDEAKNWLDLLTDPRWTEHDEEGPDIASEEANKDISNHSINDLIAQVEALEKTIENFNAINDDKTDH